MIDGGVVFNYFLYFFYINLSFLFFVIPRVNFVDHFSIYFYISAKFSNLFVSCPN